MHGNLRDLIETGYNLKLNLQAISAALALRPAALRSTTPKAASAPHRSTFHDAPLSLLALGRVYLDKAHLDLLAVHEDGQRVPVGGWDRVLKN
jgi:hypothetical protein